MQHDTWLRYCVTFLRPKNSQHSRASKRHSLYVSQQGYLQIFPLHFIWMRCKYVLQIKSLKLKHAWSAWRENTCIQMHPWVVDLWVVLFRKFSCPHVRTPRQANSGPWATRISPGSTRIMFGYDSALSSWLHIINSWLHWQQSCDAYLHSAVYAIDQINIDWQSPASHSI